MENPVKVDKSSTDAYRAMLGVEKHLAKCSIKKSLQS